MEGGKAVGTGTLNANGVAVLTLLTLSPGTHSIQAVYAGDGMADASTSVPLQLAVKQATNLTVSADSNPALTLSAVRLTATLTNAGAAVATGQVVFTEGTTVLGTGQLDAQGHASLLLPQLTAGTHILIASYPGDGANFTSTSTAYREIVQLRPTTTSVTGSSTDDTNPQQITLIAVVKGEGSLAPGGTVTFSSGAVTLGQAAVDETGVATITVIFETKSQDVLASYRGHAGDTSAHDSVRQSPLREGVH